MSIAYVTNYATCEKFKRMLFYALKILLFIVKNEFKRLGYGDKYAL